LPGPTAVSDVNVVSLTERRIALVRERHAVASDEGWRLIRAFRQIPDPKRRAEIIALVERFVPPSPDWPTAG
jgi:hypothetical protein